MGPLSSKDELIVARTESFVSKNANLGRDSVTEWQTDFPFLALITSLS